MKKLNQHHIPQARIEQEKLAQSMRPEPNFMSAIGRSITDTIEYEMLYGTCRIPREYSMADLFTEDRQAIIDAIMKQNPKP